MELFNAGLCALYGPVTVHTLHHNVMYCIMFVNALKGASCKCESPVVSSCSIQKLAGGGIGKGEIKGKITI